MILRARQVSKQELVVVLLRNVFVESEKLREDIFGNTFLESSTTKREENPASPVQDSEKSDEDIV